MFRVLGGYGFVLCNPMKNRRTCSMKYEEFKKYVNDNVDVSMESDGNQEEGVFSYGRI